MTTPPDSIISLIIVEDQTLMRQGLKTILDLEDGLRVIGEATNGREGVRLALELRPDIILMDVQMPELNGVQATREICVRWSEAKVIILTTFNRDDYVYDAVRAGAVGFLLKDAPVEQLIRTIQTVQRGEAFIQPEIAARALREMIRPTSAAPAQAQSDVQASTPSSMSSLEPLSDRERDVLTLLAQGLSNKDIADKLYITEGTVKNHVSSILGKLQANNRTQAAEVARRTGLV